MCFAQVGAGKVDRNQQGVDRNLYQAGRLQAAVMLQSQNGLVYILVIGQWSVWSPCIGSPVAKAQLLYVTAEFAGWTDLDDQIHC